MKKFRLFFLILFVQLFLFCENGISKLTIHNVNITDDGNYSLLRPLQGVIAGPVPTPNTPSIDLTNHLQDIGVTGIRTNGYWYGEMGIDTIFRCPDESVFPSWECDANDPSNYHWQSSDVVFQSILDGGFEPFLRIGSTANNAIRTFDFHGPQNRLQEDNWIIAAKKIIDRYNNWNGKQDVLEYVDIITEWPNEDFWDRSNKEFIIFWARAFREIKSAFPNLKVGGPGFLKPTIDVINGKIKNNQAVNFLSYLYEHRLKPDWIGWHLWYNDPEMYYKAAHQFRALLDGTGDFSSVPWAGTGFFSDVKLICDAYGVSMLNDSSGRPVEYPKEVQFDLNNRKEGAAILTGNWIALQYSLIIERAYYYRAGDENSNPSAGPFDKERGASGLFYGDPNGTYKPKANAIRLWSIVYNSYPELLKTDFPSVANDNKKLYVLAAKNDDNQYAVLVANLNDEARQYNIFINNHRILPQEFQAVIFQVDDVNDGRTPYSWHGNSFMIPAHCVQLVLFASKEDLVYDYESAPQIGLNFIRLYFKDEPPFQPENIFRDFSILNIHSFRQLIKADLLWDQIEPQDDQWNFELADEVIMNAPFEPIVILFANQYASPTPPWAKKEDKFQKTLGPEALDYLLHVVERYGPYVRYWQIGNEMEHWRAALEPGAKGKERMPEARPADGFSPYEQGMFLAQVARFVKEHDPDAIILMPAMGALDDNCLDEWLAGVIQGGGKDWFDIIDYHYYGPWQGYWAKRMHLKRAMEEYGIEEKFVWNTETGSTSSPTLTIRTNYPNSDKSQAADIFRRIVQAWAAGDRLVQWHTYIGSPEVENNAWRSYGILDSFGRAKISYFSFALLANELTPFVSVQRVELGNDNLFVFNIVRKNGAKRWVAWGKGSIEAPEGVSIATEVIPNEKGEFSWFKLKEGQALQLSDVPILLK